MSDRPPVTDAANLPALLGGAPLRPAGPPDWPCADDDVLSALEAAYRDGSWGKYHGGFVERLEAALRDYHGVAFAVTCASGTAAVELALRGLKIGSGNEVILAGYDYGGNFLNVHAVGAQPVLVDVAAENWNLDTAKIEAALTPATRAVIVSHLHGGIVPMADVMDLAQRHGFRVIEDAAQSPGVRIAGRKAGTWGDVGILSFGGSKLLSAGRGGALLTAHADVHQRVRSWTYRGNQLYPLSELQAAVLLPQLAKLDARNAIRARNVQRLAAGLRDVPGINLFRNRDSRDEPAYYKVGMQLDAAAFGLPRDRLVSAMRAEGIALDEGFRALHVGRSPSRYRTAGELRECARADTNAMVLHHPVLLGGDADIDEIVQAFRKVHAHANRLRV